MGFADASLVIDSSHRKGICEDFPSVLFTVIVAVSKDSWEHSLPQSSLPKTVSCFCDSAFVAVKNHF